MLVPKINKMVYLSDIFKFLKTFMEMVSTTTMKEFY